MKGSVRVSAFKPEPRERVFWETHDSTALVDWSKTKRVSLSKPKPQYHLMAE